MRSEPRGPWSALALLELEELEELELLEPREPREPKPGLELREPEPREPEPGLELREPEPPELPLPELLWLSPPAGERRPKELLKVWGDLLACPFHCPANHPPPRPQVGRHAALPLPSPPLPFPRPCPSPSRAPPPPHHTPRVLARSRGGGGARLSGPGEPPGLRALGRRLGTRLPREGGRAAAGPGRPSGGAPSRRLPRTAPAALRGGRLALGAAIGRRSCNPKLYSCWGPWRPPSPRIPLIRQRGRLRPRTGKALVLSRWQRPSPGTAPRLRPQGARKVEGHPSGSPGAPRLGLSRGLLSLLTPAFPIPVSLRSLPRSLQRFVYKCVSPSRYPSVSASLGPRGCSAGAPL
ncbi:uncharacterized protein [Notamacropus eugenii]|uniref:uncharacterized protein n=1 Tax=Notamacropus eugenii TaxID=9315 RepID=UPI003B66CD44